MGGQYLRCSSSRSPPFLFFLANFFFFGHKEIKHRVYILLKQVLGFEQPLGYTMFYQTLCGLRSKSPGPGKKYFFQFLFGNLWRKLYKKKSRVLQTHLWGVSVVWGVRSSSFKSAEKSPITWVWPPHSNSDHQDYEPFLVGDPNLNLHFPLAS